MFHLKPKVTITFWKSDGLWIKKRVMHFDYFWHFIAIFWRLQWYCFFYQSFLWIECSKWKENAPFGINFLNSSCIDNVFYNSKMVEKRKNTKAKAIHISTFDWTIVATMGNLESCPNDMEFETPMEGRKEKNGSWSQLIGYVNFIPRQSRCYRVSKGKMGFLN